MDGSHKIPQRWRETLAWHQARGARCPSLEAAIAAWIAFLRSDHPVDDPLADKLREAAAKPDAVERLFGKGGLIASDWRPAYAGTSNPRLSRTSASNHSMNALIRGCGATSRWSARTQARAITCSRRTPTSARAPPRRTPATTPTPPPPP